MKHGRAWEVQQKLRTLSIHISASTEIFTGKIEMMMGRSWQAPPPTSANGERRREHQSGEKDLSGATLRKVVGGSAQSESNRGEAARCAPLTSPSGPRPGQVSGWPADNHAEELPPGARALPTGADVPRAIGRTRVWPEARAHRRAGGSGPSSCAAASPNPPGSECWARSPGAGRKGAGS